MDKERNSHKHTEGTASASLLSIRGLSAAYDGRTVLHDVNLEVYERDFLGIIGPNVVSYRHLTLPTNRIVEQSHDVA